MQATDKLIAVIVPVYQVEPYLQRCIDSIVNQTHKEFELILIDDGSPDNCPSICDENAKKDPRIHVIHQQNGGISAARNAGLEWFFNHSKGRYIAFIDSDDWIHPQYLEVLYQAIIQNDADTAVVRVEHVLEGSEAERNFSYQELKYSTFELIDHIEASRRSCTDRGNWEYITAWGKLFRRELLETIRFPVGKRYEDLFVIYILLYYSKLIAVSKNPLYYYFRRSSGFLSSTSYLTKMDWIQALKERAEFYRQHKEEELRHTTVQLLLKKLDNLYFCIRDIYNDQVTAQAVKEDFVSVWRTESRKFSSFERMRFLRIRNRSIDVCWPVLKYFARIRDRLINRSKK